MDEIVFRFGGVDLRRITLGVFLIIIITLAGFILPFFLLDNVKSPKIPAASALGISVLFVLFYTKFVRGLWTVKISNNEAEICLGSTRKARFSLVEIERMQVRGWERTQAYKILRLKTKNHKINIFVDNTGGFTTDEQMKIFGNLIKFLETYTLKHDYQKIDLRKASAKPDFINFSLQKKHYYE